MVWSSEVCDKHVSILLLELLDVEYLDEPVEVLKHMGYKVSERLITVEELIEANAKGEFKEMFGTGTAAVISPVGELKCGDTIIPINNGEIGEISQMLYDKITGMQFGKIPDEFGWTVEVK